MVALVFENPTVAQRSGLEDCVTTFDVCRPKDRSASVAATAEFGLPFVGRLARLLSRIHKT